MTFLYPSNWYYIYVNGRDLKININDLRSKVKDYKVLSMPCAEMRQRHSLIKGYCFCYLNISPLLQWLLRLQWSALQDKLLNFVAIFFIRWKTPDFDPSRIRLLIYSEIDGNRIILFDSKAVIKREEKVSKFSPLRLDIPYFFSLYYRYLKMNYKKSVD